MKTVEVDIAASVEIQPAVQSVLDSVVEDFESVRYRFLLSSFVDKLRQLHMGYLSLIPI